MFVYNYRIYDRFKIPVTSVAILVFHGADHFLEMPKPVGSQVKPHVHHHPPHRFRQSVKGLNVFSWGLTQLSSCF